MSDDDNSDREDIFADKAQLDADLGMLEIVRWYRMVFTERVLAASRSREEEVLYSLRLEATYQLAEFYYVLKAREIRTENQIKKLAELHNAHIVHLTKDPAKMRRLGLKEERLLKAIFHADILPRLLLTWRERPGAFDQSNLARLLASVMSAETCRTAAAACAEAGFLLREETPYGPTIIESKGVLEDILGRCLREARQRLAGFR
jgi:hypothetical protein